MDFTPVFPAEEPARLPIGALAPKAGPQGVDFAFAAPDASRVTVAGTFNGWDKDATPLGREGAGPHGHLSGSTHTAKHSSCPPTAQPSSGWRKR
jgi:hypothetical protein